MSYILILGASSDMGRATAHEFAKHGYNLYLAGRNKKDLEIDATDISQRYSVEVETVIFDALKYSSHKKFFESLPEEPYGVLLFFGYLGDQEVAQNDFKETEKIIHSNYTGAASILNIVGNAFEKKSDGVIVGVSSVAGDRGRMSNYIYGSSKAALTAYLSGMRQRLAKSGVAVVTVKPGFVNTKMTAGLDLPAALTAEPEHVASDIFKAFTKKHNVVYTKSIWKLIMLIIRHIPEFIFKKTSI